MGYQLVLVLVSGPLRSMLVHLSTHTDAFVTRRFCARTEIDFQVRLRTEAIQTLPLQKGAELTQKF